MVETKKRPRHRGEMEQMVNRGVKRSRVPRHQSEARGSSSSKEEFAETVLALNSCQLEGGPVLTRRGKTRRREYQSWPGAARESSSD